MTDSAAVLALCRFVLDAAALLVWGATAYLAWLVPPGLAVAIGTRIRRGIASAVAVALIATLAKLPVEAAAIGDGWRDGFDPPTVFDTLTVTHVGEAWAAQALAVSLLVLAQVAPSTRRLTATAVTSGLLLASLSLDGHAAMHEGALGLVHRADAVAHVLCAGAWLGALWPVVVILDHLGRPDSRSDARTALVAFSRAGHVAVALALVSGTLDAALVLGRWPAGPATPYQILLVAKILCVAAMVGLALANRYVVVPRLGRRLTATMAFRWATLAEIALGLMALALVATFGLLDPS